MISAPLLLTLLFQLSTATWFYGLQLTEPASNSQLKCMLNNKYTRVFPRVFQSNGDIDWNGIQTLKNAENPNNYIQAFGYMVPQVTNSNGAEQVDKLINAFGSLYSVHFTIQVTQDSAPWSSNTAANVALINSLITRADERDRMVDINTSYSDWVAITGNVKVLARQVTVWYINVHKDGVTGETPANFDDYVAFGPFQKYLVGVKTFARKETVCGLTVDRNVANCC